MLSFALFTILPFVVLKSTVAWVTSGGQSEAATWTQWLSLILSRGIYIVLAFLIILCVIYTVLKNKFGFNQMSEIEVPLDPSNWLMTLWKTAGCDKFSGCQASTFRKYGFAGMLGSPLGPEGEFGSDLDSVLKEKLKTAETEVSALRGELESSHRSRLDLESSLELLDKDKMTVEEKLELERVNGILEVEKLKRENASTQRELQRVMQEKQELGREVESLQREARIAESALRDQQSLQARLEEAKREVDALKAQMVALQAEKEMAVSVVSDIMVKATKRTAHPHHLEPSVPTALPFSHTNVLMMIDQVGDTHGTEYEYDRDSCQESREDGIKKDGGEGEMWVRCRNNKKPSSRGEEEVTEEDDEEEEGTNEEDDEEEDKMEMRSDPAAAAAGDEEEEDEEADKDQQALSQATLIPDDDSEPRLVTGSTAFRKFLESNNFT